MKRAYSSPGDECVISVVGPLAGEDLEYEVTRVGTAPGKRRQGYARQAMRELLADADREGAILILVSGLGADDGVPANRRLDRHELRDWYTRLGFDAISPGSYPGTTLMQRVPRPVA